MDEKEYFVPTNDYVFKRIFGYIGNEEITKALLNEILDTKVESVNLAGNTILEKDLMDEKMGILDIKAKLNNEISCDVEMQVASQDSIEKRILFYWSKLYVEGIKKGESYDALEKSIVILFTVSDLENLECIPKGHTEWKIREKDFEKIVLTEMLEIHIIELKKMKRLIEKREAKEEKLKVWAQFLLDPKKLGETEMSNEMIKKAKEQFDEIEQSDYERRMAELRMKHIRDTMATEKYGYKKGLKERDRAAG